MKTTKDLLALRQLLAANIKPRGKGSGEHAMRAFPTAKPVFVVQVLGPQGWQDGPRLEGLTEGRAYHEFIKEFSAKGGQRRLIRERRGVRSIVEELRMV